MSVAVVAGSPVVIQINAGAMLDPACNQTRFDCDLPPGTEGVYIGAHPTMPENDWHIVRALDEAGREVYAPLHSSQFSAVPS